MCESTSFLAAVTTERWQLKSDMGSGFCGFPMCLSGLWCPSPVCLELAPQSCDEGQWRRVLENQLAVTVFPL